MQMLHGLHTNCHHSMLLSVFFHSTNWWNIHMHSHEYIYHISYYCKIHSKAPGISHKDSFKNNLKWNINPTNYSRSNLFFMPNQPVWSNIRVTYKSQLYNYYRIIILILMNENKRTKYAVGNWSTKANRWIITKI